VQHPKPRSRFAQLLGQEQPKGKAKEETKPTPTPSLERRKGKETKKEKGKLQPLDLDIRQGAVCFPFSTDGDSAALAHSSKLRPACSDLR
jgi:hypothetical protein